MKKSVLILMGLFLFSFGVVSADSCTSDADCTGGAACSDDGECVLCEDSDGGRYVSVYGTAIGVDIYDEDSDGSTSDVLEVSDSCYDSQTVIESLCIPIEGSSYLDLSTNACASGYACKDGVCVKSGKASTSLSKKTKLGAAELDSGSALPWILGGLGVLLIGGVAYWYLRPGKKSKKK